MNEINRVDVLKLNTLLFLLPADDTDAFNKYILEHKLEEILYQNPYKAMDLRPEILKQLKVNAIYNRDIITIQVFAHLYYYLKNYNIYNNVNLMSFRDEFSIHNGLATSIIMLKDTGSLQKYKNTNNQTILALLTDDNLKTWINEKVEYLIKKCNCYKKIILSGVMASDYQHILDREAIDKLEKIPRLKDLTRFFFEKGLDQFYRIQCMGSHYKHDQSKKCREYSILTDACNILGIERIPDLYFQIGFLNASTMGVNETMILLTSDCSNLLMYDEMQFVIGHELGHIKSKHILYHQMAKAILDIGTFAGTFTLGISSILTKPLYYALLNWYRKSEFSADRAGLLACQNIEAAIRCMTKLAGFPPENYEDLNIDDFIKQAKEFDDYVNKDYNILIEQINVLDNSHPWLVKRCSELIRWYESGEYKRIIDSKLKLETH